MSEIKDMNLEITPAEQAETVESAQPAAEKPEKARKAKKRKRTKVALPAAAVMLVIALLFGVVVGYILGRSEFADRLREAEAQLAALTEAFEDAAAAPVYDAFTEELTAENRSALNDLAGADYDSGVSDILGEEDILGQMLDGGEAQEPVVVAEYSGGVLMSDEVAREYEDQLTALVFAGYSEEEIAETLLTQVMQYMVGDRVMQEKAREMGVYELTEADEAEIDTLAQQIYDDQLEFYSDYVNTEGMTESEAAGAVKSYMLQNEGITLESIRSELEEGWWMDKLYDEITRDVTITDAELQKSYDALLEEQKASFEAYVDDYEYAQMNGETIVYNLDGYRGVRMLLFAFDDFEDYEAVLALSDELAGLDPVEDAETIAQYVAEIDSYYKGVEDEALDALNRLSAGEKFEDLLISIGDDEGMKDENLRATGYYVAQDSLLWPQEIISTAMEFQNPGDISGAIRVADGVCILQYVGQVQSGAVPLEDVEAQLADDVLESACYSAYEQQLDAWLQEAGAVYYPERMQ